MACHDRYYSASGLNPICALGGSLSGYASMSCIDSLNRDLKIVRKVWSTKAIIIETIKEDNKFRI